MNNVDIPLFVWWDGHNEEQCLFLNEHLMLIYLRNELATYWNNYNTGLQVKTSPRLWYFVFSGFLFLQNSTILLFPSLFNHSLFTVFHLLQIRHKRWKKAQNNTRSKATAFLFNYLFIYRVHREPSTYLEMIIVSSRVFSLRVRRSSELQSARVDVKASMFSGEWGRYQLIILRTG